MEPIHVDVVEELYTDKNSYINWLPREIFNEIMKYFEDDIITNNCYIEDIHCFLHNNKTIQLVYTILLNGKSINFTKILYINRFDFYRKEIRERNKYGYCKSIFINEIKFNDIYVFFTTDDNEITLRIGDTMSFDKFRLIRCYPRKK